MRRPKSPVLVLIAVLLIVGLGVTELAAATHRIVRPPESDLALIATLAMIGLLIVDQRPEL